MILDTYSFVRMCVSVGREENDIRRALCPALANVRLIITYIKITLGIFLILIAKMNIL